MQIEVHITGDGDHLAFALAMRNAIDDLRRLGDGFEVYSYASESIEEPETIMSDVRDA